MSTTAHIAKHLREVFFGGNWTDSNLKDQLSDLDWRLATAEVGSVNTIAALVFHIQYYVGAILPVLEGKPLDAHDKFSFDLPPMRSQEDWETLLEKTWDRAERLVARLEQLPDAQLFETFVDPKYGTYYRNLHGLIEHTHYHLGQIVLLKKILREQA